MPIRRLRILLLALGLLTVTGLQAACLPEEKSDSAIVAHVHDGDTVILANGDKLRLIGVDTPELGDDRRAAEPLAVKARDFVRELLGRHDNRLVLLHDEVPTDIYRRRLAHVFLPDDRSLSEILLREGLATALVMPPNIRYADCYALAESSAHREGRGLWSLSRYRPVEVERLGPKLTGFRVVRGKVLRFRRHRQADYIYLGKPGDEKILRVKIAAEDRAFFPPAFLKALTDKPVEIRARIHHQDGRFFARIRYPTALQIPTP